ncbi:DNA-binding transcriptional regulator AraC [compost metagenome]
MLVVLLKRLIIFITRLAKSKYIPDPKLNDERLDVFRKFNLLVEANFRTEHSVNYYAQLLNKSPKTLSNLFALYNQKTPIQVIQDRIIIEAKRLLSYTNKSAKEITHELGFDDAASSVISSNDTPLYPPLSLEIIGKMFPSGNNYKPSGNILILQPQLLLHLCIVDQA